MLRYFIIWSIISLIL